MKYDSLTFLVKHYIREGTKNIKQEDVDFSVKRHVRDHYIGLSNLTSCGRLLWAKYYRPELIPSSNNDDDEKSSRIFDLGHLIEDMTLKILIAGGADLSDAQISFSDFSNIVRGHADSILDKKHVIEIKSMNQKSFERFVDIGIKRSHETYYVQMQMYMYYSKLKSAVIIATNKNTSQIECEAVYFDQETVNFYLDKLKIITNNTFPNIKAPFIGNFDLECNFCVLKSICHKTN